MKTAIVSRMSRRITKPTLRIAQPIATKAFDLKVGRRGLLVPNQMKKRESHLQTCVTRSVVTAAKNQKPLLRGGMSSLIEPGSHVPLLTTQVQKQHYLTKPLTVSRQRAFCSSTKSRGEQEHHSKTLADKLAPPTIQNSEPESKKNLTPPRPEFLNKSTILSTLNQRLTGKDRSPSVEYIYVNPPYMQHSLWRYFFPTDGSSLNPYGHSAIKYTLRDGSSTVMNIVGKKGIDMVHFIPAEEYFFGHSTEGNEQGGIHKRSFYSLRVENVDQDKVDQMHEYFLDLQKKNTLPVPTASFSLAFGPLWNFLRKYAFLKSIAERGNCAYWTSQGLKVSGVLPKASMFPKLVFVRLFFNCLANRRDNPHSFHIVGYRCVNTELPRDSGKLFLISMPFIKGMYHNLGKRKKLFQTKSIYFFTGCWPDWFTDAIVKAKKDDPHVLIVKDKKPKIFWRDWFKSSKEERPPK